MPRGSRRAPSRPRAATGDAPPTVTGPLGVCVGGACDGFVYYISDLQARAAAYAATGHGMPAYQPTDESRPWKLDPSIDCQVWRRT